MIDWRTKDLRNMGMELSLETQESIDEEEDELDFVGFLKERRREPRDSREASER